MRWPQRWDDGRKRLISGLFTAFRLGDWQNGWKFPGRGQNWLKAILPLSRSERHGRIVRKPGKRVRGDDHGPPSLSERYKFGTRLYGVLPSERGERSIQGSAADIIKKAMICIHQKLKERDYVQDDLQVHDELNFKCNKKSRGIEESWWIAWNTSWA